MRTPRVVALMIGTALLTAAACTVVPVGAGGEDHTYYACVRPGGEVDPASMRMDAVPQCEGSTLSSWTQRADASDVTSVTVERTGPEAERPGYRVFSQSTESTLDCGTDCAATVLRGTPYTLVSMHDAAAVNATWTGCENVASANYCHMSGTKGGVVRVDYQAR